MSKSHQDALQSLEEVPWKPIPLNLGRLPKDENPPRQGQLSKQGGCPNIQFTRLSQLTGRSPREKSWEDGRSPLISSLRRVGTAELQQP